MTWLCPSDPCVRTSPGRLVLLRGAVGGGGDAGHVPREHRSPSCLCPFAWGAVRETPNSRGSPAVFWGCGWVRPSPGGSGPRWGLFSCCRSLLSALSCRPGLSTRCDAGLRSGDGGARSCESCLGCG